MKKLITLAVLLSVFFTNAQVSSIKIKSKIPLVYESRGQLKDTIYISINQWTYDPAMGNYKGLIVDEIKENGIYKTINTKDKYFEKAEVDGLFTMLQNPILTNENYSDEMDVLLKTSLLIDTQNNLFQDGKTVYGGLPENWETVSTLY